MKILAGDPNGKNAKKALELGCGSMMVCHETTLPGPRHAKFQANGLALDNGAFSCHAHGRRFDKPAGELFQRAVERASIFNMLFVVCPDKVMAGIDSLDFSEEWRPRIQYPRIALAVQDGMHGDHLEGIIDNYQYLFIGGSVDWKWKNAFYWITWAHAHGLPAHIGQCGQIGMLQTAARYNADSCDSSSWCVNEHRERGGFDIVKAYRANAQQELGLPPMPMIVPPLQSRKPDNRWISRKIKKAAQ